jgi:hypothetical protein
LPYYNTENRFFRHKELAGAPPTLPAVREEEDDIFVVEFGETELHRQAAVNGLVKLS